jgi:hypothetical protein
MQPPAGEDDLNGRLLERCAIDNAAPGPLHRLRVQALQRPGLDGHALEPAPGGHVPPDLLEQRGCQGKLMHSRRL